MGFGWKVRSTGDEQREEDQVNIEWLIEQISIAYKNGWMNEAYEFSEILAARLYKVSRGEKEVINSCPGV